MASPTRTTSLSQSSMNITLRGNQVIWTVTQLLIENDNYRIVSRKPPCHSRI